jgi:hypothetical protein
MGQVLLQIGRTALVACAAGVVRAITIARAVLGDIDLGGLIVLMNAGEDIIQPWGIDLPAHLGVLLAREYRLWQVIRGLVVADDGSGVIVEAQKVGWRGDGGLEQSVHQAAVEIETFCVALSPPSWLDPRPRDREAVSLQAQFLHQGNILSPAMVVVAGHVTGRAILDLAGGMAEAVSD